METPEERARKNDYERQHYRPASELSTEELVARRARQAAYMREYNARDREAYNAKRSEYGKIRSAKLRAEAMDALGNVCKDCGHSDTRVLQFDHIAGGGRAHRKKQGGYHYWRTVLDRIEEFHLLCANCHMIKTYRHDVGS